MIISRCAQTCAVAVLLAGTSSLTAAQTAGPTPSQTIPAQTIPAQTIPGLDDFSLPPSRPTPQVTPVPQDTPAPTPTPAATPAAAETRAARPIPRATPTSTPAPRSTPTPAAMPTVAATPTPVPTPTAAAPPAAGASPEPQSSPAAVPAGAGSPGDPASAGWGEWIAAGAALAAIVAGIVWWRRRREGVDAPPPATMTEPLPLPLPSAQPTAAPAELDPAAAPQDRAHVAITLHPRRAGLNLLSATVEAELLVRNAGNVPAASIRVGALLLGASAGPPGDVAALFAQPIGRPVTPPFALAPGEERRVRLVVALPRAEIPPLQAGGRAMFVPVVAVNTLYDAGGPQGQTAQAFAVGVERVDSAKLAPLWLDQPARMFDALCTRPYAAAIAR